MIGYICKIEDRFIWIRSKDSKNQYVFEKPVGDERKFKVNDKVNYELTQKDKDYYYAVSVEKYVKM